MNTSIDLPITILARNLENCVTLRRSLLLIPLVLACFGLSAAARAVSPPPDGGYAAGNTAEGTDALFNLTTGVWNSAFGFRALHDNATGIRNTAIGYQALYNTNGPSNVSGQDNIGVGANALFNNTTGKRNIAIGSFALYDNTTGSNNIAIGDHASWHSNGSGNTVIGDSFASGPDFVSIGRLAVTDCRQGLLSDGVHFASINAETDVEVGQYAPSSCLNVPDLTTQTVHINAKDAVFVRAVYGNPIAGSPVVINSSGQLGVAASSARFKDGIKPMDKTSEVILALKPVSFRYKQGIDPSRGAQFGLVAEEVEKVNPDLVTHDREGKPYTVRYDAVNAMLLNEFLKEHRKVHELEATVARQQEGFQATVTHQQQQIDALTAGLQKVSTQIQMSRPAAQIADNKTR
jgi:hypothetical protein